MEIHHVDASNAPSIGRKEIFENNDGKGDIENVRIDWESVTDDDSVRVVGNMDSISQNDHSL